MMKDIEIKINRETRMVDLSKSIIGNDGENLQGNLVFSFADDFVKGQGRLEYVINGESKYAFLLSNDENYYIPIKSVMTKEGQIDMQLVITEGTDVNEIPIFKSNVFYVSCKKSINAEVEEEEEYYSWIEIANTKLNEVDEAIEELASQSNYAKEQGDYAKEQGTNAKNVADDTQKKAEEGKFNGKSLEFVWEGTKLGVRLEGQEEYHFVDLQGVQGEIGATGEPFKIKKTYSSVSEMNADFGNMQFGDYVMIASSVNEEDNAKLYTRGESAWIFISDFSGAMGIRGETGLTPNIQIGEVKTLEPGSQAKVTRSGSNEEPVFNFELPKGDKGDDYVLTEEDKVEIGEKVNTEYEKRIEENEKDIADLEATIDILTNTDTKKGELVHITDALGLPVFETKTSGNVKQETTKGTNEFNAYAIKTAIIKVSDNGKTITMPQSTVDNGYINTGSTLKELCPNLKVGDIVYLYFNRNLPASYNKFIYVETANFTWYTGNARTITQTDLDSRIGLYGNRSIDGEMEQCSLIDFQITKVANATWEKYTNGASPNPEYPQEIEVVEGDLSYKVNGKNLFNDNKFVNDNFDNIVEVENGYTFDVAKSENVYTLDKAKTNTPYTFKGKIIGTTGANLSITVEYTDGTKKYAYETFGDNSFKITTDGTKTLKSIIFTFYNQGNFKNYTFKEFMLSENDDEYEPYQEQIVPLDLKGNFVGKINDDIKDYLVTDKKRLWLVKNTKIKEYTANNVTKMTIVTYDNIDYATFGKPIDYIGYGKTTILSKLICDKAIWSDDWCDFPDINNIGKILETAMGGNFWIGFLKGTTEEEMKEKLSNFKVLYQLKEPQIIELGELPEPIKTFEGTNNIQVLANIPTEIEVKYALDLQKKFDNKIAEISAQII